MVTKTKLIAGAAVFVSWGVFIAIVIVGLLVKPSTIGSKMPTGAITGAAVAASGDTDDQQGQQLAAQPMQVLTPAVVAQHSTASDCWMIIDGKAYDLTAYLPTHPGGPGTMVPYCGKDATTAFATKDKGSSHSSYATALLAQYFIGDIGSSIPGGNPAPNDVQKKPSAKPKPVSPSLSLSPSASNPAPVAPPPVVPPPAAAPALTPTVVSQHSSASDCWMIVGGKVYDVTGYLPFHPAGPGAITPYCGRDATVAFGGVGHSSNAQALLQNYFVGDLVGVVPDGVAPVISVLGLNPATVAVGSVYVDAGATALDAVDGVLTSGIVKSGLPVSTVSAGVFVVSYSVRDAAGNLATASRTVNVVSAVNQTPPVNQTNQTNQSQNSTIPVFTAAQVAQHSVASNCWMIVGGKVYDVTGYLPFHPAGSGAIVPYCGRDATVAFGGVGHSSNAQNLLRNYYVGDLVTTVPDTVAPVITVLGLNPATVAVGSVYVDAGATALDAVDGVLTSGIVKSGLPVSTVSAGVFVVSYSVRDAAGNLATASRTVNVVPPVNNTPPANSTPPVNQTNQTNSTVPVFTAAQVAQHSVASNCWMIVGGKVYDVTGYLPFHPAGSGAIVPYCGRDATVAFGGVGHSSNAQNLLRNYYVGELVSATPPPPTNQTNSTNPPPNSTGPKTYTVSVNSAGAFNQTSLAMRAGDTVRFYYTNPGDEVIILFSPSPPSSMTLDEERRSRSYTFTLAGSWVFRNSVSSSQGTITVR